MASTRSRQESSFNVIDGDYKTGPYYDCVQEFQSILALMRPNPQSRELYKGQLELLLIKLIALEGDPECRDSEVYLLKAQICVTLKKNLEAKEAFNKALEAPDLTNIYKLGVLEQLARFWMTMNNLIKAEEYLVAGEQLLNQLLQEYQGDSLPAYGKQLAAYLYVTRAAYHHKLFYSALQTAKRFDADNPLLKDYNLQSYKLGNTQVIMPSTSSSSTAFFASQPPATARSVSSPAVSASTVETDEHKKDIPTGSSETTTPEGNSPVTFPQIAMRTTPTSTTSSAFFPLEAQRVDPATIAQATSSTTTLSQPRNPGQ